MFLVNSRHPHFCATSPRLPEERSRFFRSYAGNLPSSFNTVLSSALVSSTSPPVSVSGTVCTPGLFPGSLHLPAESNNREQRFDSVTPGWPRTINLVPIGYGFRPRLRGRLTLRGLTLRRNPWTFGDSVSRAVCRYSCQHSHFRYLQGALRRPFTGLRNAPLPIQKSEARSQKSETLLLRRSRHLRASPCSIFEMA